MAEREKPVRDKPAQPTPQEFAAFVPFACAHLRANFNVYVRQTTLGGYSNKNTSKSKRAFDVLDEGSSTAAGQRPASMDSSPSLDGMVPYDAVVVTAACDSTGRLVELMFDRCTEIPSLLLCVIALCLPFHPALARIAVRWGPPASRCVHELAKLLPHSNVTELCLDDTPALEGNFDVLLRQPSQLRSLSLARCKLADDGAAQLATRLRLPAPAARSLLVLSLASNAVGDAGAAALGEALRTNRALRSLNLAGNRIGDDGAAALLSSLATFRLRPDEVTAKRRRVLEQQRRRLVSVRLAPAPLPAAPERADRSPPSTRRKTMKCVLQGARPEAVDLPAVVGEPFDAEHTVRRADGIYCYGNLVLSHLNLSYNNIQATSVVLLLRVLRAQDRARGKGAGAGLLLVQLDGNWLPVRCAELDAAAELLVQAQCGDTRPPRRPERAAARRK